MSLKRMAETAAGPTPSHYEVWHWTRSGGGSVRHTVGTADNLGDAHELKSRPYRESGRLDPVFVDAVYPDGSRHSVSDNRFGPASVAGRSDFRHSTTVAPLSAGWVRPPDNDHLHLTVSQAREAGFQAGDGLLSRSGELISTLAHARELLSWHGETKPFLDDALRNHDLTPLHAAADHLEEAGKTDAAARLRLLLGVGAEKYARAYASAARKPE